MWAGFLSHFYSSIFQGTLFFIGTESLLMPLPGMLKDGFELAVFRFPTEKLPGLGGIGR